MSEAIIIVAQVWGNLSSLGPLHSAQLARWKHAFKACQTAVHDALSIN